MFKLDKILDTVLSKEPEEEPVEEQETNVNEPDPDVKFRYTLLKEEEIYLTYSTKTVYVEVGEVNSESEADTLIRENGMEGKFLLVFSPIEMFYKLKPYRDDDNH